MPFTNMPYKQERNNVFLTQCVCSAPGKTDSSSHKNSHVKIGIG